jgi:hypothetical protein
MTHKKAVDKKGLAVGRKIYAEGLTDAAKAHAQGVGGDILVEPIPNYLSTPCEKVYQGQNNTLIKLGRDRIGNRLTGYGGRGDTQCGAIDIVAGRMGYLAREVDKQNNKLWADPNFKFDAARIYISQKTDIDDAFRLSAGVVGNHQARSGIGIKADHVRVIAREGIKLVTGGDARNSQGGKVDSVNGIDLIAGNDDSDMQPLVKGKNLSKAISALVGHVQKLTSIVDTLLTHQMKMNQVVTTHTHISPFYGLQTAPSTQLLAEGPNVMVQHMQATKMGIMAMKQNLVGYKHNYLSPAGPKYINSRFNNTN